MNHDYERIEAAIEFIAGAARRQPSLDDVAAEIGLSPFHCQRLFRRWAGVSPKRFLQFLTVEHAKDLLDRSASVLDASLEVGLSGPGRLHDHFVVVDGVTPGEYARGGDGLAIRYGVHGSPFGPLLLALTDRGACAAAFTASQAPDDVLASLERGWPNARIVEDHDATLATAQRLFDGHDPAEATALHVRGTNFQVQVWKALLEIPMGAVCSYEQVARAIDRPSAARAVGTAVGANPVACIIPCHRVIRSVGGLGGYRWGTSRKRALLAWESARLESMTPVR